MTLQDFKDSFTTIIQSSFIGSFIGMLPGLGPSIGGFVAHKEAHRTTKHPEMLGKGSVEGVAAAEAGNSSVSGSNLIPLLSFGIPGDAEAAMVMAALMLHGLYPGPQLLETDGPIVYGIFISLIVADIVLLFIGLFIIKYLASPITKISSKYLYTAVLILMLAGTYGITQSLFDLWVLVIFGLVGLLLRIFEFSIPAFIIGFILGGQFEGWLQRTIVLVKHNPIEIISRPSVIVLLIVVVTVSLLTTLLSKKAKPEKTI